MLLHISVTQSRKPLHGQEIPPGARLHKGGKNITQTCNLSENLLFENIKLGSKLLLGISPMQRHFSNAFHEVTEKYY